MKLSAFTDRVKSLDKTQRSNTTPHKDGEVPTIPISPVVTKSSDDEELSLRARGYGAAVVPYEYRLLKESEIRILELFPGARMEPISCRLVETPIGDAGDFEAVSYTWGTEEPTCSIQIEGRSFFVRPNLEAASVEFRAGCCDPNTALETMSFEPVDDTQVKGLDGSAHVHDISKEKQQAGLGRGRSAPRRLWIDAICIDQSDFDERNQQIGLMSKIYSNSKNLAVWLGDRSEGSDQAIGFLSRLGRETLRGESNAIAWILKEMTTPSFPETYRSIAQLLRGPWFTRAWILQEYILGGTDDGLFICGQQTISSKALFAVLDYRQSLDPQLEKTRPQSDSITFQELYKQSMEVLFKEGCLRLLQLNRANLAQRRSINTDLFRWNRKNSSRAGEKMLTYWLDVNRPTIATDPRDKVFAVLGILESMNEHWIFSGYDPVILKVDYSATVENVFSSVVQAVVTVTGRLDILGMCSTRGPSIRRSWTPDWTVPGNGSFLTAREGLPLSASARTQCVARFAGDLSILSVQGLIWDIVDFTFTPKGSRLGSVAQLEICRKTFWEHLRHFQVYGAEAATKQAILRIFLSKPLKQRHWSVGEKLYVSHVDEVYKHGMDLDQFLQEDGREDPTHLGPDILALFNLCNSGSRSLVTTRNGYIGQTLYKDRVREGDIVCVLLGCSVPMLLRPIEDHYELVGEIYLEGIMYGEAMKSLDEGKVRLQEFELH